MKFKNKKTGDIKDWDFSSWYQTMLNPENKEKYECNLNDFIDRVAKFRDEWEDAEDINVPNMPLIKDEKVRKAVRAWAEANELLAFKVVNEHFNCSKIMGYGDHNIGSRIGFKTTIAHANKDQLYSIAELCGEDI